MQTLRKNVRAVIRSLLQYLNNIFKSFICTYSCGDCVHPDFKVDLFSFIYVLGLLVKLTGFAGVFLLLRQIALTNQRTILGGVPNSSQIQEVLERFLVTAYMYVLKLCQ